jgi:spermidine synthase
MAIYFVPSILLAMVSPLGVKLAARADLTHLGRSAGNLYAVSTAGSIVGTITTSFWLIPLLSIEPLVVSAGFVLLAMALLALRLDPGEAATSLPEHGASARMARLAVPATFALALATGALGGWVLWQVAPAPAVNALGEAVLFRADTQYHRITVTEDEDARHLRFDRSHQSAISLEDPYESRIRYPDYMHLALALKPDPERVLVLGLGGGAITKRFWRDYPGVQVDSVEIDPVVIDVARTYFWLPEDERMRVFNEDARRYVQRTGETYDIVVVDAYTSDSLPFHLTTSEFFAELEAIMSPDGVVAYNVIAAAEGDSSELFRSMYRTAGGVFDDVWVFPIGLSEDHSPTSIRNIAVLATSMRLPESELRARIASRVGGIVTVPGFEAMAADLYTAPVPVADVPLLTDAYAPVDSLIKVQ